MSDIKIFENSSDMEIESIFERKIELGAVIQFNLLQKVLEEFIKRQQSMNEKISDLDSKIAILSSGGNEFDLILQNTDDNYESSNKNKDNEGVRDKKDASTKEKFNFDDFINNNRDNINDDKDFTTGDDNNKASNQGDKYKKLVKRIERLELMNREMVKLMKKSTNEIKLSFVDLKSHSSRVHKTHENKINELSKKLADINIFEMFKDNNSNSTSNNSILNTFEQKLAQRFESLEEKNKLNDESIYRLKKDIVNIKNLTENISRLTSNNNENILSLEKDLETKIKSLNSKIDEEINKLKELCNNNFKENKNIIENNYNELNNKLDNLVNDLNEYKNKINNIDPSIGNEKLNDLSIELRNYINKSVSDSEGYLKSIINNLNIDKIKKDISEIHDEINQNKLLKKDIELINNKISGTLEKKLIELYQKVDAQATDINLCNDTCDKTVKMVEYLSGQMGQTYQPDLKNKENSNYNDLIKKNIDMTTYMTKDLFKEEKNKLIQKIEKTLEIESENYTFIQQLEERLKYLASENDLKNMEQCILNLIEELKINFNKKFLDKNEAQKSFKLIELQLKQLIESGSLNNKEADNWLLAKKPINNYVCASCETYLGELKNKNIFLPWNKIPSREEKKYRMGQGFSRMLQLVNMDLLKTAEKMNNDLLIKHNLDKNEDKKILENKKLPKINSQMNLNPNSTYTLMHSSDSMDHGENDMNNSADNVEPVIEEKKSKERKKIMNSSLYNKSERDKNAFKNFSKISMKTNYKNNSNYNLNKTPNSQEPQVMRIIKKVKK